jgi:ATPase subunit of ABC transporter with duplicated ATPase domains
MECWQTNQRTDAAMQQQHFSGDPARQLATFRSGGVKWQCRLAAVLASRPRRS